MEFLTKNLKWITIIFIALFLMKTCQSCNRGNTIESQNKKFTNNLDSISKHYSHIEDSLNKEILAREYMIKDLSTELKIAGIKYDEAQKRADAVQKTVEKIKTNTTIEIKNSDKKDSN